jgi:hypothetical protein
MAKKKQGLQGVGNQISHQNIISDLIFGVRKKLVKRNLSKKYNVVSEVSISQLGYKGFTKDHNIDFVVYDSFTNSINLIIEIERKGKTFASTKKKVKECLESIGDLKEAFIVTFEGNDANFFRCTLEKGKLKITTKSNSKSEFLKMNLKTSLVSLK